MSISATIVRRIGRARLAERVLGNVTRTSLAGPAEILVEVSNGENQ
jgi:hypothetical protein